MGVPHKFSELGVLTVKSQYPSSAILNYESKFKK
jgi:hypothetical protein